MSDFEDTGMTNKKCLVLSVTLCSLVMSCFAQKLDRIVSLKFKDAQLVDVLNSIAKQNDLNIIIPEEVKGTVTVSLDNVDLKAALDTILAVNNYAFVKRGNIISIVPLTEKESETQVLKLNYVQANTVMALLQPNLSARAKIQVDTRTNTMIISSPELADFDIAKKLLKELDKPISQVLIKAKIVEVTLDESDTLGINWETTVNASIKGLDSAKASLVTKAGNFSFSTLDTTQLTAIFSMLMTKMKSNLLSSPEIVTLDNQSAKINVGRKIAYQEATQTAGGTTYETKFIDVGTMLTVTPQIHRQGMITLDLHPEVSDLTGYTPENQPLIGTKEATTKVTVREGQTIVIGGLITEQVLLTKSGIPILKDIPILGHLFGTTINQTVKTNLLIFVTPYILNNETIDKIHSEKMKSIGK